MLFVSNSKPHISHLCLNKSIPLNFGLSSILSNVGCKVKHNPKFIEITLGKTEKWGADCYTPTKIPKNIKLYLTLGVKSYIIKAQQKHERKVNPMLNKFLVAGRMTADPEIKTVGENRLCKFTIACDRPKRKGEETAETDFFPCTAWNRNADVIVDWFGKGDMVTLVGSVHNNRYEKDGQKHSSIEVKVEEIHFSGGKKKQENTAPTDNGNDNPYAGTPNDPLF